MTPPEGAECLVFTYKEGLLSAVAHDLEIRVESWTADVDAAAGTVEARFDARSLRVVRAIGGNVSERDKETIGKNIAQDVLDAKRYPEIRFRGARLGDRVEGVLSLHGREKSVSFVPRDEGGAWSAEVRLHQPDFGIKPYSAMLGTLRIQPDVLVRVTMPK